MTTYVDIYFQLFLFTEILLTFLFSNMSKIVSQLLEIVRNTELNRYSAADRLSLVAWWYVRHFSWRKSFAKISQIFIYCKSVTMFFWNILLSFTTSMLLIFFIEQRVQEYLPSRNTLLRRRSRKEVFQPHLPVRLPCYDLVPIASPTFDGSPHKG